VPTLAFEVACVAIVAVTLAMRVWSRPAADVALEYLSLAVAGWVGEQTCISFYRFYEYAPEWHARLGDVPVLVPLIWPLVILSARDVARVLAPRSRGVAHAALVGGIVAFDASLVEVVAVRAGLWRWVEPGHLGVPPIGVLGWGYFAFGATWISRGPWRLPAGPVVAHVGILGSWWALFRWRARGDLGLAAFGLLAIASVGAIALAASARRAGRAMPRAVWLPRALAASLFLATLAFAAPASAPLWMHAMLVAFPYLVATGLRA
jgi:hypothetical protein